MMLSTSLNVQDHAVTQRMGSEYPLGTHGARCHPRSSEYICEHSWLGG